MSIEAVSSTKSSTIGHSKPNSGIPTEPTKKKPSIFDGVQAGAYMAFNTGTPNSIFA